MNSSNKLRAYLNVKQRTYKNSSYGTFAAGTLWKNIKHVANELISNSE